MKDRSFLVKIAVIALALLITEKLFDGISIDNSLTLLAVAVLIGILNAVIKPLLVIITIPITVISLGLFYLVINALILMLAAALIDGFTIASFGTAFWGAIVLSFISMILENWFKDK